MNLSGALFPDEWLWFSHGLLVLLLAGCALRAPWRRLAQTEHLNLWLGACVFLMGLWSIKAGIRPGLNFHLLGSAAFTLLFGPHLAVLGIAIVVAAITLNGNADWAGFSLNVLCMGAIPVLTSHTLYRFAGRLLPDNYFVYIFVNAFMGGALAMAATGLSASALLWLSGVYGGDYLLHNYLSYFVLLGWSEALLTGMVMSMAVVYRPHWVTTFDDQRYLHGK